MNNTIAINPQNVDEIIRNYREQRAKSAYLTVELDGLNDLDVLALLSVMEIKDPSVRDLAPVLETVLDGHSISFKDGDVQVCPTIHYNRGSGNALHMLFSDKPYLYDVLQQTVYALLLKKLTPHLEGSD